MHHPSFASSTSVAFGLPGLSRAVGWADAFAWHLQGLGATDGMEVLRDLGERFYPTYRELDPSTVADSLWAKWPTNTSRRTPTPQAGDTYD